LGQKPIPTDRLRLTYFDLGFQYYAAGRCGVAAWWNPVAANLMHHAIEMFLKGGLCPHTTKQARENMRHDLPVVWRAFKAQYDPAGKLKLNRFDAFVRALHSYEEIRYPEKMVRDGMGSYFQFGKRTTRVKASGRGANVPKYQLFVADADAMVKAICDASSINAKAFTSKYQQEPGKTFLRHENAETGLFQ
jgi:hypothetical protein